jgi:hypothetical protein
MFKRQHTMLKLLFSIALFFSPHALLAERESLSLTDHITNQLLFSDFGPQKPENVEGSEQRDQNGFFEQLKKQLNANVDIKKALLNEQYGCPKYII